MTNDYEDDYADYADMPNRSMLTSTLFNRTQRKALRRESRLKERVWAEGLEPTGVVGSVNIGVGYCRIGTEIVYNSGVSGGSLSAGEYYYVSTDGTLVKTSTSTTALADCTGFPICMNSGGTLLDIRTKSEWHDEQFLGNKNVIGSIHAKSISGGIFHALGYGSGMSDTEVQAAIDDANSAGGGIVVLSAGTWTNSGTITLYSNISLIGLGATISGGTLSFNTASNVVIDGITFSSVSYTGTLNGSVIRKCTMTDLDVTGDKLLISLSTFSGTTNDLTGVNDLTLENSKFTTGDTQVGNTTSGTHVNINNCVFEKLLSVDGADRCEITNTSFTLSATYYSIKVTGDTSDFKISKCKFEGVSGASAITFDASSVVEELKITNSEFYGYDNALIGSTNYIVGDLQFIGNYCYDCDNGFDFPSNGQIQHPWIISNNIFEEFTYALKIVTTSLQDGEFIIDENYFTSAISSCVAVNVNFNDSVIISNNHIKLSNSGTCLVLTGEIATITGNFMDASTIASGTVDLAIFSGNSVLGTITLNNSIINGDTQIVTVSAGGGSFKLLCNDSGSIEAADKSDSNEMPAIFVQINSGTSGAKFVATSGVIVNTAWSWTPGETLYVDNSGDFTSTKPTTSGDIVQVVGIALSADSVKLHLNQMTVEI